MTARASATVMRTSRTSEADGGPKLALLLEREPRNIKFVTLTALHIDRGQNYISKSSGLQSPKNQGLKSLPEQA